MSIFKRNSQFAFESEEETRAFIDAVDKARDSAIGHAIVFASTHTPDEISAEAIKADKAFAAMWGDKRKTKPKVARKHK